MELIEDFIDITYAVRSSQTNLSLPVNITNSELITNVLANESLLALLANRTGLSAEYINETIFSVYESAQHIQGVYDFLNSWHGKEDQQNTTTNSSSLCGGRLDSNNLIITAFIPAIIIMIILSFVNTRLWRKGCCNGRPGLAIPVNLLDSYEDRFTFSFAFAATASRIVQVLLNNDFSAVLGESVHEEQENTEGYVKALLRILAAFVIGVSYYPFFACISTHQRLLGAIMGTIYSTIWFLAYLFQIIDCVNEPNATYTVLESVLLQATSILCHGLLLLSFIRVLIRCLISKRRGMVVSKHEWKENYKYHYVKKLLKPVPKSNGTMIDINSLKQKISANVYHWRPDFKYSTRIVCIYVTGCACLYMVAVSYAILSRYLKIAIDLVVDEFEAVDTISVSPTGINWSRVKEGFHVTITCWLVAIAVAGIKDLAMMGNMLSWYRGHILRLQRGDRSFLPYNMDNQDPLTTMVSSFKFAGYQTGYIIWSFVLTHLAIFLILTVIALGFIWPLTWGSFKDAIIPSLLVNLWPTILITLITIITQRLLAKYVFLRDYGAMLALNNRRLFHIVSYFLYFLNIFVGLFSCLIRIFYAIFLGALFLPRLQKSALPRDWELFDPGYKTYIGYLFLEHTHANPVLFTFNRVMREAIERTDEFEDETNETDIENVNKAPPRRAKIRWFLAVTLINNPSLQSLRRREEQKDEKKEPGAIKQFTAKVGKKIVEIRENCGQKIYESKL
ncbi:stimulated by retinoic acid gene 6 protein-like [Dendronephthya gigantea]|uniref:stimulated by retinoic acid gene 6 protein-like n=1 Tax=Dendronephthya gigantea TaxID=151771 RepID=UPI001069A78A|nr:stimulated by retinoic acid gene 6 protein-like [Dendronephthya gigantea]XP_028411195.1 stimulated by retinoic acid gene 6 protein-like [Dendronephthya gigantea]XP_028411196.1 stimulated by retinoic acid gene 6 protein-like [Dendronephthya gigantea]XP_028411197.1 stimulated by retinoic acid gene 6 protein-like [Dendronephthya gigantea]XP_028411198.1 stimulated by retinoic acid gene 6 protein-like [Dendronephthya gigantea]